MSNTKKVSNKTKINNQINKAIATTVVVTAIGISSTINSLPVRAVGPIQRSKNPEMYHTNSSSVQETVNLPDTEVLEVNELITRLLKEGYYQEAREVRKSFFKHVNPLASSLRKLHNYAVHYVAV